MSSASPLPSPCLLHKQVIASGYTAVLGKYVRWYFILFWAIGVVVMLNVMVAFVLDSYEAYGGLDSVGETLDDGTEFHHDRVLLVNPDLLSAQGRALKCDGGVQSEAKAGKFEVKLHHLPLRKRKAWRKILFKLFDHKRTSAHAEVKLRRTESSASSHTSFKSLVNSVLTSKTASGLRDAATSPRHPREVSRSPLPLHLLAVTPHDEVEGGGTSTQI